MHWSWATDLIGIHARVCTARVGSVAARLLSGDKSMNDANVIEAIMDIVKSLTKASYLAEALVFKDHVFEARDVLKLQGFNHIDAGKEVDRLLVKNNRPTFFEEEDRATVPLYTEVPAPNTKTEEEP